MSDKKGKVHEAVIDLSDREGSINRLAERLMAEGISEEEAKQGATKLFEICQRHAETIAESNRDEHEASVQDDPETEDTDDTPEKADKNMKLEVDPYTPTEVDDIDRDAARELAQSDEYKAYADELKARMDALIDFVEANQVKYNCSVIIGVNALGNKYGTVSQPVGVAFGNGSSSAHAAFVIVDLAKATKTLL